MTLKEQLQRDLHQAIKEQNAQRKSAIRLVYAGIMNEEIARQHELSNKEVLEVIRREIKQHRESLSEFEKASRVDLVAEERAQLDVLVRYLPPQMSRDEIVLAAREAITEAGAVSPQHLGQVMRILMPRLQGMADGGVVNQVVKELLSDGGQGKTVQS